MRCLVINNTKCEHAKTSIDLQIKNRKSKTNTKKSKKLKKKKSLFYRRHAGEKLNIIMSMNLVRKFLRTTSDEESNRNNKKKRRIDEKEEKDFATKEDIFGATVSFIVKRDDQHNEAVSKRIKPKRQKQAPKSKSIVGNSRTSSSQSILKPQPTWNKKRHRKIMEEKKLQKIAKLLSKQRKKK